MRVLWFPGNGAIYANTDKAYGGGGWTGALAKELIDSNIGLELGMAIPWKYYMEDIRDGVSYYGIPPIKHGLISYQRKLDEQVSVMQKIVNHFRPDIIHVFGSEHTGGMVATVTKVPVVLHLQGILNYLEGAWLPQGLSWGGFILMHPKQWQVKRWLKRSCATEQIILSSCRHYMGRTDMDYRVSRILSPYSSYYYCSEMLRPAIYHANKTWSFHHRKHNTIISIISPAVYKGADVILKTAQVLKHALNIDFKWDVYGVKDIKDAERLSNIRAKHVNVECHGVVTPELIVDIVSNADVFVHPSYIENSPNTVCEAQVLGIPVIANYVGGTPSLISHKVNGILISPNDAFLTASYIIDLISNEEFAKQISKTGRETALRRHNPQSIVKDVIDIYSDIIEKTSRIG